MNTKLLQLPSLAEVNVDKPAYSILQIRAQLLPTKSIQDTLSAKFLVDYCDLQSLISLQIVLRLSVYRHPKKVMKCMKQAVETPLEKNILSRK